MKPSPLEVHSGGLAVANPNPRARSDEEDDEPEEGEIVGEEDPKPSKGIALKSHPLENSWTFWYHSPAAKAKDANNNTTWESSMVYTFSTVEEFWSIYNNIHQPSKLKVKADLYCFKFKIKPKWEDPICANGGKWTMNCGRAKLDTYWLYTLLEMIGEQFDHGDEICGAVVNVRGKAEKISIWTKNARNEPAQVSIGKQWKKTLDCHDVVGFIFHDDAKKDRLAKNKYVV